MKKKISYREKLLELSKIYNISEIKNYISRKKNLTTSQLEHILKKNNVPIPKEFNLNFFEIKAKNFSKSLDKTNNTLSSYIHNSKKSLLNFLYYVYTTPGKLLRKAVENSKKSLLNFLQQTWKTLGNIGLELLNIFPKLGLAVSSFIGNITINSLNSIYNNKVYEKKTNDVVAAASFIAIIVAVGIVGLTVFDNFKKEKIVKLEPVENKQIDIKEKKKIEIVKTKDKSKEKIDKILTIPDQKDPKTTKKIIKKKEESKIVEKTEKKPSKVAELVLPNLNLKTETVLSLFADVEYDLKKVRFQKRVKPIYFTQFPKDLDEIKDVKLKKDTFIKIVLPLIVAENKKILDDRTKLRKITSKKITTDKQKLWLRQKLREYKVKKSDMAELKKRMDIIPVSIAIAQAAKESGWGTSRFALEGNAIFGQWTWTGQGIEPLNREKHEDHKILRFPILRASVKAYKNNLNTHKGYSNFREKRFSLRSKNRNIEGLELTNTLKNYAQTGKEYTEILEQIIEQNKLGDFEKVQLTNSVAKRELNL
jgi:uncharacterized FlgJ-related protein